jgi:hypothetical protein
MCLTLVLGKLLKKERETKVAFFAAFVHDMARTHDGKCTLHGTRAAEKKLPLFLELFQKHGLEENDTDELYTALCYHCKIEEIEETNPYYNTTALLKDADALDRIRMGENNLNVSFLRFKETKKLIPFSKEFYNQTCKFKRQKFADYILTAEQILGYPLI